MKNYLDKKRKRLAQKGVYQAKNLTQTEQSLAVINRVSQIDKVVSLASLSMQETYLGGEHKTWDERLVELAQDEYNKSYAERIEQLNLLRAEQEVKSFKGISNFNDDTSTQFSEKASVTVSETLSSPEENTENDQITSANSFDVSPNTSNAIQYADSSAYLKSFQTSVSEPDNGVILDIDGDVDLEDDYYDEVEGKPELEIDEEDLDDEELEIEEQTSDLGIDEDLDDDELVIEPEDDDELIIESEEDDGELAIEPEDDDELVIEEDDEEPEEDLEDLDVEPELEIEEDYPDEEPDTEPDLEIEEAGDDELRFEDEDTEWVSDETEYTPSPQTSSIPTYQTSVSPPKPQVQPSKPYHQPAPSHKPEPEVPKVTLSTSERVLYQGVNKVYGAVRLIPEFLKTRNRTK